MMLRIAAAIGIASLVTVIGFQFARILQINQLVVAALCSQATVLDWPGGKRRLANRFLIFRFLRRCLDRLTMHMER